MSVCPCYTLQVLDLKEHELEWVARHLGHDISVHREYYRLRDNTAEVVKVGKLLLAAEEGLSKYAGKKLEEVTLSDIDGEDEDEISHGMDSGEESESIVHTA